MPTRICFSLIVLLSLSAFAYTQQPKKNLLQLKNASYETEPISQRQLNDCFRQSIPVAGNVFVLLQFEDIPDLATRNLLKQNGIELLEFIPPNAYTARVSGRPALATMKRMNIRSILSIGSSLKMNPRLLTRNDLESFDVIISYFKPVPFDTVSLTLRQNGFSIIEQAYKDYQVITVNVPRGRMQALAQLPFVIYIEPSYGPAKPLNYESRNSARANILQSTAPGGYNLTGEGVVIGIAEAASPVPFAHIDFRDRVIQGPISLQGITHPTIVFGIAAGAGNNYIRYKGYAPKAKIISSSQPFSNNPDAHLFSLVNDKKMVVSNNSYATGGYCSGPYSLYNAVWDKVSINLPTYIEVYAGGNWGDVQCTQFEPDNYTSGFNTLSSGGNSAKNTLCVGNTYHNGLINPSSSKGPGSGGIVKPDITAVGSNVISTTPNYGYAPSSGTSMSSPAVVGGLALLHQRYNQLHNGSIPEAGLMKTILVNSATDLGNKGPDYTYGYGWMNLLQAVRTIDNNWYLKDSLTHQQQKSFSIPVPEGTGQLKVMIYWQDPPANALSSVAIVNDLELRVKQPSGESILPYILDPNPARVNQPATRGEDHRNNIEQVVIDRPVAGNYTLEVKALQIGLNPNQSFWIAYDLIPDKVELTFPSSGDPLLPNEKLAIQWEDAQTNESTYTIEFSPDNGATWQLINANVPATQRLYDWTVPSIVSEAAKVRIHRNAGGQNSESISFVIIGTVWIEVAPIQCPGYIGFTWAPIPGATDYEVFIFRNNQIESLGTTTNTQFLISGVFQDTLYFFSARARINGKPGLRGISRARTPADGTCIGTIANGDIQVSKFLLSPKGRKFTSQAYDPDTKVSVRLRNLDDEPSAVYSMKINVNDAGWITENVPGPIPGSSSYDHVFAQGYDFSTPGTFNISVAAEAPADMNHMNDTTSFQFVSLDNPPVDITMPFIDSFSQTIVTTYAKSFMGLTGAERYDYAADAGNGLMTTGTSGVYATGKKELYLSATNLNTSTAHHRLVGTYNLASYDTTVNDVSMQLVYSKNGQITGKEKLYFRGKDTDPWAEIYSFQGVFGQKQDNILTFNLTTAMKKAGQNYSTSSQFSVDQIVSASKFSISKITLYEANNDLELQAIDSTFIQPKSCNLGSAVPIKIRIRNNGRGDLNNIRVKYSIDNGAVTEEIIPALSTLTTIVYTFTQPANFSAFGKRVLRVWVENAGDSYPGNNIREFVLTNQPSINAFPYLQDFEQNAGEWYTEGKNSSWEYGMPASARIDKSASGTKAWKTKLNGTHNGNELSYLYSPCFDLTSMKSPRMSFNLNLDLDYCYSFAVCEAVSMQFSTDGRLWRSVEYGRSMFNWEQYWGADKSLRWKVTTNGIIPYPKVMFRFFLQSDEYISFDGVGLDDFHIYDSIGGIYNGPTLPAIEKQAVGGSDWVHFKEGEQVVASIHPNGQDLGLTKARVFKRFNTVPNFHGQYYLGHEFLLSSEKKPMDSITVRLYFRDKELDLLIKAIDCPGCTKVPDAFRLGVSAYHTPDASEYEADLLHKLKGSWNFISRPGVRIVPFEEGYYAEFKVKELSQYWLSNGGLDNKSYLPVQFTEFTAVKSGASAAMIQWSTASEINIDHFDLEAAEGNLAYESGTYTKIAEVASRGSSANVQAYSREETSPDKRGVYYYRMMAFDPYGNYSYSKAIPVVFSSELTWQVFPNPSVSGLFNLSYQLNVGEMIQVQVFNSTGGLVKEQRLMGNGFVQRGQIDLGRGAAGGVYLMKVRTEGNEFSMKLIKQ